MQFVLILHRDFFIKISLSFFIIAFLDGNAGVVRHKASIKKDVDSDWPGLVFINAFYSFFYCNDFSNLQNRQSLFLTPEYLKFILQS